MSKADKLLKKLQDGNISAAELRTLLRQLGWVLDRTKGSHQQWLGPKKERFTLATHSKELKKYQIREIQQILGM